MSFTPGQWVNDPQRVAMISRAFRKKSAPVPVALTLITGEVHAGHFACLRAAKRIRGAVVIVAWRDAPEEDSAAAQAVRDAGADVIFPVSEDALWPHGQRTRVNPADHGLESPEALAADVTFAVALLGLVQPTDAVWGENRYERLIAIQHAVSDLHLRVRLQGVPTVRSGEGIAVSAANPRIPEVDRPRATALSAALTAGAHVAEEGAAEVERVAREVLKAAGVEPAYLAVRGRDLGDPPAEGDARLLVGADIGGVHLVDSVGLPLGIGFRNLDGS